MNFPPKTTLVPHIGSNLPGDEATKPAWLVSVRDESELSTAIKFAVDIIDLKEPNLGPLAPVCPEFWAAAASLVHASGSSSLLSAALGEREQMLAVANMLPKVFAYAKVGPSECSTPAALQTLWQDARARLPNSVELVAVAYADFANANTLPPQEIFQLASEQGFDRCLIDTFTKQGQSTVDVLGADQLECLSNLTRKLGLWWALAGSIRCDDARSLLQASVAPDCFGVRGDVCSQDRTSTLCDDRMLVWSRLLRNSVAAN